MSENDCVFCKIVRGEMVRDEEEVLAFEDISQKAPVHVLVDPKQGARLFDGGKGRAPGRRGEASLRGGAKGG